MKINKLIIVKTDSNLFWGWGEGAGHAWGVKIEEVKGTLGVWLQMLWPRLGKTGGEAEMRQNIV